MQLPQRILFAVGTLLLTSVGVSAADFRPPAVPLVLHDPYFSVWSMADKLTDQRTKHWTGAVQSLCSLVRVDGATYRIMGADPRSIPALPQTKLQVSPTHTRYEFEGAGIRLSLVFLNPSLPNDLEMVSRPVTYVTWSAQSLDGTSHGVQFYFDASYELAVNVPEQPVVWGRLHYQDLQVLRLGSQQQPVLQKSGDNLRIDWGYLYVVAPPGSNSSEAATGRSGAIKQFSSSGRISGSDEDVIYRPYAQPMPVLAETFDLGPVSSSPVSRHAIIAYDDVFAIDYFYRHLLPYWRRGGSEIGGLLTAAIKDYDALEKRSSDFDRQLMADLTKVGGQEYAQLCALAFPQTIAAHKLVVDLDGSPLYFSKENFSNGSIDTVDVTYPSSPFFLLFNPRLLEAQLKPVLDYASLRRWKFPFAPHDLGRYPLANGQQYGGGEKTEEDQMPVEESGNMLLMIAGLAQVNGNADFAKDYWPLLLKWAEFLRAKGLDPENQLSTDDFAGHLAHNANLSIKAILAMGAFGKLAGELGHSDLNKQYSALARDYVQRWQKMGLENSHFRLAFDQPGTWSQKYNLVWDKLLGLNLFPKEVADRELAFYKSHTNRYGLPLDNRADYTKIDWLAWTASLSGSPSAFATIFDPAYRFAQESSSRVPLTDWYDTKTGKQSGFQARSVVGGIFIQMLTDPEIWKRYSQLAKQ
ncbi:MAG: glutaminase domain-containing protein [Bryobacteraceae bacterium]